MSLMLLPWRSHACPQLPSGVLAKILFFDEIDMHELVLEKSSYNNK